MISQPASYYHPILNIVNDLIQERGIPMYSLGNKLNVLPYDLNEIRNGSTINQRVLLDMFNYLVPDKSQQDYLLLKEASKLCDPNILYKKLPEIKETCNITEGQLYEFMNDTRRRIITKQSVQYLKEHRGR